MSEEKRFTNKKLIVVSIAFVLVCGLSGVLGFMLISTNNDYNDLSGDHDDLLSDYEKLLNDLNELGTNIDDLEADILVLEGNIAGLEFIIVGLNDNILVLEGNITGLNNEITNLVLIIDDLNIQITTLTDERDILQLALEELGNDIEELESYYLGLIADLDSEIITLEIEIDGLIDGLADMTLERDNLAIALTNMTTERDNLIIDLTNMTDDYLIAQQNYEDTYVLYIYYLDLYNQMFDEINQIYYNTGFSGEFYSSLEYRVNYDGFFFPDHREIEIYTGYEIYFGYRLDFPHPSHSYGFSWTTANIIASYCVYPSLISEIAYEIESNCYSASDYEEVANAVLDFVQEKTNFRSIVYNSDGINDFSKYPIETLVEENGDCEDKAILYSSLMHSLGYDTGILIFEGHVMSIVALPSAPTHNPQGEDWWIEYNGLNYYTCETTGDGWFIGDLPPAYQEEYAYWSIL